MTEEISNKTLAMLLVAAIVVSLGGTLVSLNKLGEFRAGGITGFATEQSGTANLSITQTVAIYLSDSNIQFGPGIVNTSITAYNNATLLSNKTNARPLGTWDWTSADYFTLENIGNVDTNISVYAEDPDSWIGGGAATGSIPLPLAWFAMTNEESGACTGTQADTWTTLDETTNQTVCDELSSIGTSNEINISVKVLIPSNATDGSKTNTVIFTGELSN